MFLDIEGAYDNVSIRAQVAGMIKHGVSVNIINWYEQYLKNRITGGQAGDTWTYRELKTGTPQGGIISPVVFDYPVDDLLAICDESQVDSFAFADDVSLECDGPSVEVCIYNIQQIIAKVERWALLRGLRFSIKKLVAMMFTNKHKQPENITNLELYGHIIPYVESVRYLGVILDKKLSWKNHIDKKIRNAKFALIRARNALGTLWGPCPRLTKWLYTGIICPAITYAAMIWGRATSTSVFKLKAQKLQRLALLTASPVRHHSPGEALQVVSFVPPLELLIESIGVATYQRIKHLLDLSQTLPGMWFNLLRKNMG